MTRAVPHIGPPGPPKAPTPPSRPTTAPPSPRSTAARRETDATQMRTARGCHADTLCRPDAVSPSAIVWRVNERASEGDERNGSAS